MKNNLCYLIVTFILIFGQKTYANLYHEHAVGWRWYNEPKEIKKEEPNPEQLEKTANPNEVIASAREKLTTALNTAVVTPTKENIRRYILLQELLNQRAEVFAKNWQEVLLENPSLNYSLTHPTNNVALQVYHDNESKRKTAAIQTISESAGLFFFYRNSCPYCRRFAPILKQFAQNNHLTIIPVTLDGISLPEFPDSKIDTGQATKFNVQVTPALFAVNPYTQKAIPVAYGLVSMSELEDNIYKIISEKKLL